MYIQFKCGGLIRSINNMEPESGALSHIKRNKHFITIVSIARPIAVGKLIIKPKAYRLLQVN